MKKVLILGRHGNTFRSGEKVVMVGARHDLPLTEVGEQQARALGEALQHNRLAIKNAYAGPLIRTREFARIALEEARMQAVVSIDPRLTELDYGAWEGLSDQEIEATYGLSTLDAWRHRGVRPAHVSFSPSSEVLKSEMLELLQELSQVDGATLVITSNGRLREVGRLLGKSPRADGIDNSWKVGTGRVCVLECGDGTWRIVAWDIGPEALAAALP